MEYLLEILNNILYGPSIPYLLKAEPVSALAVAGISAGINLIGGLFGASKAKRAARKAAKEKRRKEAQLNQILSERQEVINPYEGVTDLSGMLENPFEKMGVATQAAEIQMEQSDIALANTLDILRATGASAGGATALAQAALSSKKQVAANIEQQEAANEKIRAQGEQQLIQLKMAEARRLQTAEAAGKQFEFQAQENRINADLDRVSGQISQAQAQQASANQAQAAAITGAFGNIASVIGSGLQGGAFNTTPPSIETFD
jgi:hypothetical protein